MTYRSIVSSHMTTGKWAIQIRQIALSKKNFSCKTKKKIAESLLQIVAIGIQDFAAKIATTVAGQKYTQKRKYMYLYKFRFDGP